MSLEYYIKTTPELLEEIGVGKGWLRNLNLTVKANPKVVNSFIDIEFEEISVDVTDFGVDLIGGDLSTVVDSLEGTIKEFIK